MLPAVVRRGTAVSRDLAPSAADVVPQRGRRADDEECERTPLGDLVDSVPGLRGELRQRERASALLVVVAAMLLFPVWTGFDLLLEPDLVARFGQARLLCLAPMAAALWLLCRRPAGLRHPQLITIAVLPSFSSASPG